MKASELVKQAYREGNIVPLDPVTGLAVTTTGQEIEGLVLLNRYLKSLFGLELGEFPTDWPVPPSTTSPVASRAPLAPKRRDLPSNVWPYPPPNARLVLNLTSNQEIFLQQDPDDGAHITIATTGSGGHALTLNGNGRLIEGSATLTAPQADLDGRQLLYRADLATWVRLTDLTADDESPLPELYDDILAIGTFIRIAPRYGRAISAETAATYKRLMKRLRAQYRQHMGMPTASPQPFIRPASDRDGYSGGSLR